MGKGDEQKDDDYKKGEGLSAVLDDPVIADLKRWQETCEKMSRMKYAILEACEYLEGNKLNQIGSNSILHKKLRDAIEGI